MRKRRFAARNLARRTSLPRGPRPSSVVRVPRDVDAVLAIAMAKDPERRFGTADELARALSRAAEGKLDAETRERGRRARAPS